MKRWAPVTSDPAVAVARYRHRVHVRRQGGADAGVELVAKEQAARGIEEEMCGLIQRRAIA